MLQCIAFIGGTMGHCSLTAVKIWQAPCPVRVQTVAQALLGLLPAGIPGSFSDFEIIEHRLDSKDSLAGAMTTVMIWLKQQNLHASRPAALTTIEVLRAALWRFGRIYHRLIASRLQWNGMGKSV